MWGRREWGSVNDEHEDLADDNLLESIREHARWQTQCEVVERDGLLLYAGGSSFPGAYRNSVVRLDPAVSAQQTLSRARAFFAERGRGFTLWVFSRRDEDVDALARQSRMPCVADGPCMLVTRPLPVDAASHARDVRNVRIARFVDERVIRDAIEVNAEAYTELGLSSDEVHATFPEPARVLSERVVGFVAYLDDRPVATALTLVHGRSAGLYWVGTVKRAQRTGLGGLCTRLATNAGFERSAQVVMLQASRFGEPLYARLGYGEYARARWYRQPRE
jgi:Acetyltransferase (GNAT) domain